MATAHFELELRLTHSCTAMVPSTNLGFVVRGFLSAKVEQQEQEVDSAACTQLSVAVVFLFPQQTLFSFKSVGELCGHST